MRAEKRLEGEDVEMDKAARCAPVDLCFSAMLHAVCVCACVCVCLLCVCVCLLCVRKKERARAGPGLHFSRVLLHKTPPFLRKRCRR